MLKLDRRTFLSMLATGSAGAGAGFWFNQWIRPPVEYLIPQVVAPEDVSPGTPVFYNSVCTLCSAGCGITVKTREGRAKKIEGNPGHPVNQGGLCALGQAGLNFLYHPDRIQTPLKRSGERGKAEFIAATWQEAISSIAAEFNALKAQSKADQIYVCSRPLHGHLDRLFGEYLSQLGSPHLGYHQWLSSEVDQLALKHCFATEQSLHHDFSQTHLLVSFGADFLHTGTSPVMMSRAYGEFRRKSPRGRMIQLEARFSATGASADQWLAIQPGSEGAIALFIAQRLLAHEIYQGSDRDAWAKQLADFTDEKVATISGLSKMQLHQLAQEWIAMRPTVAILGEGPSHLSNGLDSAIAIHALNYLSGNTGHTDSVLTANPPPLIPSTKRPQSGTFWASVQQAQKAKICSALILHECNPIFDLPPAMAMQKTLQDIPLVVAFSSVIDESNAFADWILPVPSYLERWDDVSPEMGAGFATASVAQPVVASLYDTRSCGDILLSLASAQGFALPDKNYREYLQRHWQALHQQYQQASGAVDFDTFWQTVVTSGVWGSGKKSEAAQWQNTMLEKVRYRAPSFAGDAQKRPTLLHLYPLPNVHQSMAAAMPWLQELPDPMTGVVYQTWLELNPVTAKARQLNNGDVVRVESEYGSLELPVLVYPGIHPDMVAMGVGRGHQQLGRYARQHGVNPLILLGQETVTDTEALAWAAVRVRIEATGKHIELARVGEHERDYGRSLFSAASASPHSANTNSDIPIKEL